MTPAKIYPFSIPAGGSFPLLVIGDYCKILTSSGPLEIDGDTFGNIGPILAGQGVQDAPFHRLVLNDRSGALNNGTILIADNAFIDDRISGEVSVIDGGKARTLSERAGFATVARIADVALVSNSQIWNPSTSGLNVFVQKITYTSTTGAGIIGLRSNTVALNTSAGNPASKNLGNVISAIEIRSETSAAALGVGQLNNFVSAINTPTTQELKEPICIRPGVGMVFSGGIINYGISVSVEFFTEPIL